MPDKRTHRGPNPEDKASFSEEAVPVLRQATADLSWLLGRGYSEKAALKLVGDRFSLTTRQRLAVMRSACSDQQLRTRQLKLIRPDSITAKGLAIDGYNVLISIEAALSGGVLLLGRDGCIRDLASIHGTYRKVEETIPAIRLIRQYVDQLDVEKVLWVLDSPVSNSGRLRSLILQIAQSAVQEWDVELCQSPDAVLTRTDMVVATSDGPILDCCHGWTNLTGWLIQQALPSARIIDLRSDA